MGIFSHGNSAIIVVWKEGNFTRQMKDA
jgi:hypothetical protein